VNRRQVSDYVKAKMEVIEMPRPLTAGFKAVLHAIWLKQVDIILLSKSAGSLRTWQNLTQRWE